MSELAEGARLEIVCAVNSGTEGSNPSLSAITKKCLKYRSVFSPSLRLCEPEVGGSVLLKEARYAI